jgi:nitrogen fixation NifU-like protein
MCDLIKGKTKLEAEYMINQYQHMMHEEEFDADVLEDAIVFINTSKQAARIRCATIGWNAASELLKEKK